MFIRKHLMTGSDSQRSRRGKNKYNSKEAKREAQPTAG